MFCEDKNCAGLACHQYIHLVGMKVREAVAVAVQTGQATKYQVLSGPGRVGSGRFYGIQSAPAASVSNSATLIKAGCDMIF